MPPLRLERGQNGYLWQLIERACVIIAQYLLLQYCVTDKFKYPPPLPILTHTIGVATVGEHQHAFAFILLSFQFHSINVGCTSRNVQAGGVEEVVIEIMLLSGGLLSYVKLTVTSNNLEVVKHGQINSSATFKL
jgi:hypothetical protein